MNATSALIVLLATNTTAQSWDLVGPVADSRFGAALSVLSNGKIVVTAPGTTGDAAGAAYLYDPQGVLISGIVGEHAGDRVGSGGIVVLDTGNVVVLSPHWNEGRGAVTFADAGTGFVAVGKADPVVPVAEAVSLLGGTPGDGVGSDVRAEPGVYVVSTPDWDYFVQSDAGAVTIGDSVAGSSGVIGADNSLTGATALEHVGSGGVVRLANGRFVVTTPDFDAGGYRGAVTWIPGTPMTPGYVSTINSLVDVGEGASATPLQDGNYVVNAPMWNKEFGATTWLSGDAPYAGVVSSTNSLIGTYPGDGSGQHVVALAGPHYVVAKPGWSNGGALSDAGAVIWRAGGAPQAGDVSAAIALVGTTANDHVGLVTALANGHFVIASPDWRNGSGQRVGAVTWVDGNAGLVGVVSAANSLVGPQPDHAIGDDGLGGSSVLALGNGNYVFTNRGSAADAVTWGDGATGSSGVVGAGNSFFADLHNETPVQPIPGSGGYIVGTPNWSPGGTPSWGAATWGSGDAPLTGAVTPLVSLLGAQSEDQIGRGRVVVVNDDGDFALLSPEYASGGGAVSGGHARTGLPTGAMAATNSLLGSNFPAYDRIDDAVRADGGHLVVLSLKGLLGESNPPAGATFVRGIDGLAGAIREGDTVRGTAPLVPVFDVARDRLVVGRPKDNRVTFRVVDTLLRSGFD